MKFPLVGTETSFPISFVLCADIKTKSIQNKEDITKVQVKIYIFYFGLSSKTNVDILGITVSKLKQHYFETIFTSNDVINIQDTIGKLFESIERLYTMGVDAYFIFRRKMDLIQHLPMDLENRSLMLIITDIHIVLYKIFSYTNKVGNQVKKKFILLNISFLNTWNSLVMKNVTHSCGKR